MLVGISCYFFSRIIKKIEVRSIKYQKMTTINITVIDKHRAQFHFQVINTLSLNKLAVALGQRIAVKPSNMKFVIKDMIIEDFDVALDELGVENGAKIGVAY